MPDPRLWGDGAESVCALPAVQVNVWGDVKLAPSTRMARPAGFVVIVTWMLAKFAVTDFAAVIVIVVGFVVPDR
jgi:hypothetical protein